ncbi:hypothetical protein [Acinetobacter venetianus]|uniref:hypothetical protein n=1 Tax=Acinetobacter venetianus TaxID=52133 RepID=UPI00241D2A80|nr:hypothetical protein [Acinetobacter venetianus]
MIKQTQTKMFDFSDVGLDFCAGSKNKFPEVFKKMLATGFNPQTVLSVVINDDQITLTYGVSHGYVADRVLHVTASGGFDKEVYIDSVNGQSITCTVLDGNTTGLTGTINTKIASLGWELMYELTNIHVYKMKHIDDTDRYVRLCFQDNSAHRNAIAVCIGKTYDAATGFIDDPLAFQSTANISSPNASGVPRWDGYGASSSSNNYTYSQGYSTYGKGVCIGSPYHFAFLACWGTAYPLDIYGIFPTTLHPYEQLDYPIVIAKQRDQYTSSGGEGVYGNFYGATGGGYAYVGDVRVSLENGNTTSVGILYTSTEKSLSSVLSNSLDNFNTTTAKLFDVFEHATSQHLGCMYGAYMCLYGNDSITPTISKTDLPLLTTDIDFQQKVVIYLSGSSSNKSRTTYVAFPIEEITYGY